MPGWFERIYHRRTRRIGVGYFVFRRVSDKSDPMSWWNKGFEKHDFMGKALANMDIQTTVARAIDNFFGL